LSSSPLTSVFNNSKYGVNAVPVANTNPDEHDLVVGKRWKHAGLFSTSNEDLEKVRLRKAEVRFRFEFLSLRFPFFPGVCQPDYRPQSFSLFKLPGQGTNVKIL
jgi:hypothetical protein